jgi:hypothetical protein
MFVVNDDKTRPKKTVDDSWIYNVLKVVFSVSINTDTDKQTQQDDDTKFFFFTWPCADRMEMNIVTLSLSITCGNFSSFNDFSVNLFSCRNFIFQNSFRFHQYISVLFCKFLTMDYGIWTHWLYGIFLCYVLKFKTLLSGNSICPPLWAYTIQNKCYYVIIIYTQIKSGLQLN